MYRKRKHGEGEWRAPDHGMQKGAGKGGKGGGKEPYKQWASPAGWEMVPQGWVGFSPMQPQGGSQQTG
eukprot:8082588-Heterocapsa_arctica.AAC.1